MGKKMKLVLTDLKVESFVTSVDTKKAAMINGGAPRLSDQSDCPTCWVSDCIWCRTVTCTETCNACYSDWTQCETMCGTCNTDCTCPAATC